MMPPPVRSMGSLEHKAWPEVYGKTWLPMLGRKAWGEKGSQHALTCMSVNPVDPLRPSFTGAHPCIKTRHRCASLYKNATLVPAGQYKHTEGVGTSLTTLLDTGARPV